MSKIKVDVLETVDGSKSVNVSALGTATASAVSNTPEGGIAATTVQAAINELDAEKFSKSGGDIDGNVSFTGPGRRIIGNFSGVPIANRTLFQTTVANNATTVGIIPNGTGNAAYLQFSNSSDPDNSGYGYIGLTATGLVITSTALGSGTKLPVNIDGRLNIGLDGSVLATVGPLGYGTGAGGTVTQATNKGTGVTINKPIGRITTHNASLAAGATAEFAVNNTAMKAHDLVVLNVLTVGRKYDICVTYSQDGRFDVALTNVTAGALSEPVTIKFAIVSGVIA